MEQMLEFAPLKLGFIISSIKLLIEEKMMLFISMLDRLLFFSSLSTFLSAYSLLSFNRKE